MKTHLEPDDIIAYAEDPAKSPRRQEIESHLRTCRSCVLDISAFRNLRDLEAEGLLINSSERAAEPSTVVKQYLKQNVRPVIKPETILASLGGMIAAGLASISSRPQNQPAFAGQSDSADQGLAEKKP